MKVAKGGIIFFCHLLSLFWLVYSLCTQFEVQWKWPLIHWDVSVWFHLMVGAMPEVNLHWCYMHVKCWLGRNIASRALVLNCSAGNLSSEERMAADKLRLVLQEWTRHVKVTILTQKKRDSWLHPSARCVDLLVVCWLLSFTLLVGIISPCTGGICGKFFITMSAKPCITAWYTSHPALQKDWGKGMENTWNLPLSSALLLFSCLRVFYQCYQVQVNFSVILFYVGWQVAGDTVSEKFRGVAILLILFFEKIIILLSRFWGGNFAMRKGILNVFYWSRCSWLNPLFHGIQGLGRAWVNICFLFYQIHCEECQCKTYRPKPFKCNPHLFICVSHCLVYRKIAKLSFATDIDFILVMCKTC